MGSAVIVAGGRSTRFGDSDKAVAELSGTPMIRRVADRVAAAVDSVVVNCRADQREAIETALSGVDLPVSFALDPEPDLGPMAGMGAGLSAVADEYALVVACDMPFVDPAFVSHLFERAAGHDAALPRPDEWFQTTQAVYHAETIAEACEQAIDEGDRRIVAAVLDHDYVVLDHEEITSVTTLDTFENLNTREEFEA
ncbi:MAG: molybdopterin-guanine dinucleotide biosynthesis protein A, partial [Haloarculaceae archaeon]